jgi:hypothetical protein
MTFKTLRRSIRESGVCFGNTDHFGETVTFRPLTGGAEVSIDVHVEYVRRQDETAIGVDDDEEIWVRICTDPDADRGGVAVLTVGDVLIRSGELPELGYRFTGEVRRERHGERECLFRRKRPRRYGPSQ